MVTYTYNKSIDTLKGILIITVIIGHILRGSLDENIIRYFIYSFHMPAFFYISGYLIRIEGLVDKTYKSIFKKYWQRMIKEWFIAFIIYTTYAVYHNFSIKNILYNCYNPYYHLWFVPALFLMILIVRIAFEDAKKRTTVSILLTCISILLYNLSNTQYSISGAYNCSLLFFFLLGIFTHKRLNINNIRWEYTLVYYIVIVFFINIFIDNTIAFYRMFIELPLITFLCIFCFLPIISENKIHNEVLEYCGKHSLQIYLWHMIPVIILQKLFPNTTAYYTISFVLLLILCLGIYLFIKKQKN